MNGPNLKATDPSGERGVAPPRLKSFLKNLTEDDKTIVEWVIQNFQPISSSGSTGTIDLQVCIGGVTKTVTFVITKGPS